MAQDYLTFNGFQARSRLTEYNGSERELIEGFITAASRWVDRYTLRSDGEFQVNGEDAAYRYFRGRGDAELWIDDCVSISGVATTTDLGQSYEAWTAETDYWKSNGETYDQTPYRLLMANPNGEYTFFPAWHRAVRVQAVWGYSNTPPAPVVEAVTILTRNLYLMADSSGDEDRNIITGDGMVIPAAAIPPKVKAMLVSYRKNPL